MKKITLLLTLAFVGLASQAQELDFKAHQYKPLSKAPEFTPDSNDLKEPLVYVFDRNYTEYTFNAQEQAVRYHLTHTMTYLMDDKAVEEYNKLYLPLFYSNILEKLVVRVYKDGKLVSESGKEDLKEVELENTEVLLLAIKGVSKGCFIEILRLEEWGFRFVGFEYLQDEETKHKVEFRVYAPKSFKFKMKSYNGLKEVLEESDMDRRMYRIDLDKVNGLKEEKYAFPNANRMRIEYYLDEVGDRKFSTSYPEMGRMYMESVMEGYSKNKKVSKKLVKTVGIIETDNELDKIRKLENHIKREYYSISGFPDAPKLKDIEVFASQTDVLRLYCYAFEFLEIEYEIILTASKTDRRFDKDFTSWNNLQEPLIYLPGVKMYLDPSARYTRVGCINDDFLGQDGLFIQPIKLGKQISGVTRIKTIEKNDVNQTVDHHEITVNFTTDMQQCEIGYLRKMQTYTGNLIRYSYYTADDEDKKDMIEKMVKSQAEDAEVEIISVDNTDMTNADELKEPVTINARMKTGFFIQNAGEKILLKVGELIGPQSDLYTEEPRVQPIEIGHTHKYVRRIVVKIPDGYQAKGLDKLNINIVYQNEAGEDCMGFTSKFRIEGDEIIIDCEEWYSDLSYPITRYEDYARVINAAADFNKITILFEKL